MLAKAQILKNKLMTESNVAPAMAFMLIAADMTSRNMVFAAGTAAELVELIIKIICNLILILGAFLGLMGIIHFASAQSEGDGPAKQKAVMQIASGAMLALLSALVKANVTQFSAFVSETL